MFAFARGAIVKKLTQLYRNKYKKGVDFPIKKSIIIIVKGRELEIRHNTNGNRYKTLGRKKWLGRYAEFPLDRKT